MHELKAVKSGTQVCFINEKSKEAEFFSIEQAEWFLMELEDAIEQAKVADIKATEAMVNDFLTDPHGELDTSMGQ